MTTNQTQDQTSVQFHTQSTELTSFYQAYNHWLENGAEEDFHETKNPHEFRRSEGLCAALHRLTSRGVYGNVSSWQIRNELTNQFKNAGLSPMIPFQNQEFFFYIEQSSRLMHLNPMRIKWVKDHCDPESVTMNVGDIISIRTDS